MCLLFECVIHAISPHFTRLGELDSLTDIIKYDTVKLRFTNASDHETIRFTNKFSEHRASRMTYCVSSYELASRQHRGAISWEYKRRQYS